jgi:hypothetical protein
VEPSAFDLTQFDPPVGYQGSIESCAAWATGYYLRGWYALRDGYYPAGGFAPMYTFAQIAKGQNIDGSSFDANLSIQHSQGLDTRADYHQGDFDFTTQPTSSEQTSAQLYTTSDYKVFSNPRDPKNGFSNDAFQQWIEAMIAGGTPIAISIPVYSEFTDVSAKTNWLVGMPTATEGLKGKHALFAPKYDANGLWVENSWGADWGNQGYAELSWKFVNSYAIEAAFLVPGPIHKLWQSWFPVGPSSGLTAAGQPQPVTAVWAPANNLTHLDLFVVGADGAVDSTYRDQSGGWKPWFTIGSAGLATPGQPVTAVWRGNDHLDLFVVGADGAVHSTYWEPAGSWQPWFTIGAGGLAVPGQPVTALWAPGASQTHLDLFVVGADGAIRSTYWEQASSWQPWFTIGSAGLASAGKRQPVSALWAAGAIHLDLFVTGADGAVHSTYWEPASSWQPWFTIGAGGLAVPGQPVTAAWESNDHLDLFVVGADGAVHSTNWEPASSWRNWFAISPTGLAARNQPQAVTVSWTPCCNDGPINLNLFIVGADGAVHSTWWTESSSWVPWFTVGLSAGLATPGQSVWAGWQTVNHLDLFISGKAGAVLNAFWND